MILDPDYARCFTQARIIAWQYGYSASLHGSFTRDLDIILTPWTEQASGNVDQLARLIADACGLHFRDGVEPVWKAAPDWTGKPHGRLAVSMLFPGAKDRRWVDISIMPIGGPTMAMRRINSGDVSRDDALALARIEFASDIRCEHVGWLYLFHAAGMPL